VSWLERRAAGSQSWYNRLRLLTIVGGVIIPVLVGLDVTGTTSDLLRWSVFGLSLVVALAAAVEGFFHFSDRWPHYRRTAELLKSDGSLFFHLCGPYSRFSHHRTAYPVFAAQVEVMMQRDVEVFVATVVRHDDDQQSEQAAGQTEHADRPSEQQPAPTEREQT